MLIFHWHKMPQKMQKKKKKQKYQPFHTFVPPLPDLVKTEQKFKKNKTKSRLPICSNN